MPLLHHPLHLARDAQDPNRHSYRTHDGRVLVIDREWVDEHTGCVFAIYVDEGGALRPASDEAYRTLGDARTAIARGEARQLRW